jgi:hypothetical protein
MKARIYKGYIIKESSKQWKPYGMYTIRKEGTTVPRATNEPEKLIDRLTSEK